MAAPVHGTGLNRRGLHPDSPPRPATDETVTVTVERLGARGEGVAREPSGRVLFVPRTAPGDRLEVQIFKAKRRWARGRVVRVLHDGGQRRNAPCPVYQECGGCQLQHVALAGQRAAKRERVRDVLRRIGGIEFPVPELHAAGGELGYRNRISLTWRRRAGVWRAGYHELTRAERIVEVEDCLLAEPAIRRAWATVRTALRQGARLTPPTEDVRLTLRGSVRGQVDLLLEGGARGCSPATRRMLAAVPGLAGVHERLPHGVIERLSGGPALADRWQGMAFELPPAVFLQANRVVSASMDAWLDHRIPNRTGLRMLDLYAGVGARAIRWAADGALVTAVEISRRACRAGIAAAAAAGVKVRFVCGRVENRIAELLPADVTVLNPPRSGLAPTIVEALGRSGGALAYVSCDPATQARDLARLSEDWRLTEVQPFDAFPQTSHVETIAWLERR